MGSRNLQADGALASERGSGFSGTQQGHALGVHCSGVPPTAYQPEGSTCPHPMPHAAVFTLVCAGVGEGTSCEIQIPGASVGGQDQSPGIDILSSTVTEGNNLVALDPAPRAPRLPLQEGFSGWAWCRSRGHREPPPLQTQSRGWCLGSRGNFRHSQAFPQSITNNLDSHSHSAQSFRRLHVGLTTAPRHGWGHGGHPQEVAGQAGPTPHP